MELGKARYGTGKKVFKIQDGDNVFRILPPMGKLAKAGKWNMYYRVEWGYKNTAGKNRPFQDVRVVNFNTKMVEVESAAHLRRESLKDSKVQLIAALRKTPGDTSLKTKLGEVNEAIKLFNLDSKYYMNAMDLNGQIGLLKVGSRAFKALKLEIEKLRKQGVDPLSVENGRFFNFNRSNATGNFQDTAYQVTPYKESVTINGETYAKDKVHKLDESIISRLSEEAFELSNMYPEVTPAQVELMIKNGAAGVDQVLGAGDTRLSDSDDDDSSSEDTPTTTLGNTSTLSISTSVEGVGLTSTKVSAETPVTHTTTPAAEVATVTKTDLTDDEFLKSIGAI